MSGKYAYGKRALALCDVCGFTYKLHELKRVYKRRNDTGIMACPTCWDADHPQNFTGDDPVFDPQALRDARPDSAEYAASRANTVPVNSLHALTELARVTVTTS